MSRCSSSPRLPKFLTHVLEDNPYLKLEKLMNRDYITEKKIPANYRVQKRRAYRKYKRAKLAQAINKEDDFQNNSQ
jgi:hypothetical protein